MSNTVRDKQMILSIRRKNIKNTLYLCLLLLYKFNLKNTLWIM